MRRDRDDAVRPGADQQFHFARSVIVVFDTHRRLSHPRELLDALPHLSLGSASSITSSTPAEENSIAVDADFRAWLLGLSEEYHGPCEALAGIDPYFESLLSLRERLIAVFSYFGPEAEETPDIILGEDQLVSPLTHATNRRASERYAEQAGLDAIEQLRQLAGLPDWAQGHPRELDLQGRRRGRDTGGDGPSDAGTGTRCRLGSHRRER